MGMDDYRSGGEIRMSETNTSLLNTLRRCQVAVCWLKHCEIFAMPDNEDFCSECAWNFLKEHNMTLKEANYD